MPGHRLEGSSRVSLASYTHTHILAFASIHTYRCISRRKSSTFAPIWTQAQCVLEKSPDFLSISTKVVAHEVFLSTQDSQHTRLFFPFSSTNESSHADKKLMSSSPLEATLAQHFHELFKKIQKCIPCAIPRVRKLRTISPWSD